MQLETRNVTLFSTDELRIDNGDGTTFVGTIPFLSPSVDLGGFVERIMPTAFSTTIKNGVDVRALVDHDSSKLLGRTSNQTLRMIETPTGLAVSIAIPNTSYGNDVKELVRRRDIRNLSFGFKVRGGTAGQRFLKEGGTTIRELHDVELKEVSVVSLPAYQETSVAVRSAEVDQAIAELLKNRDFHRPNFLKAKRTLLERTIG